MSVFWKPVGAVLDFEFAELSGDKVYDLSGYGNHGTIYGAIWKRGPLIGALSFDGVDDYVDIPDSPSLRFGYDSFTFELFVKLNNLSNMDIIRHKAQINTGYFWIGPYNNYFLLATRSSDTNEYFLANAGEISLDWTCIAFVRNASDNTWHTYRDGELAYNYVDTRSGTEESFAGWQIGYKLWNERLNGSVALARIYNRALTDKEIKAHANYLLKYTPKRRITREMLV